MKDTVRDRRTGQPIGPPPLRHPLQARYLGARTPFDLSAADLRGADLRGSDVTGRDLSDADLTGARLDGLRYDCFTRWPEGFDPAPLGAVEVAPDLGGQDRTGHDFSGMRLAGANFSGARCDGALFTGADLSAAVLTGAVLTGAVLDGAQMSGAVLRAARCSGASFQGAALTGAHLDHADLSGADLTGADLTGATWDSRTLWPEGFAPPTPAAAPTDLAELSALFKALGDPARLSVLGLILTRERTGEELAALLHLSEPTVSHHLARLRAVGLVELGGDGGRRRHTADPGRIDAALSGISDRLVALAPAGDGGDAYTAKVIAAFFDGERLRSIPARQKKQRIVLERLVAGFAPGVRYTESEVNTALRRAHEDVATLRRLFIAEGLMARENGVYWRRDTPSARLR